MKRSAQANLAHQRRLRPRPSGQFFLTFLLICSACAQTSIKPVVHRDYTVPRPARILVYDFAFNAADVNEYQGIMRQQPSIRNPMARQHELGKAASEALALHLKDNLQRLGFTVERVPRGTRAGDADLVIDGRFVTIDEGNPLRRLVIGFGAGASAMETRVKVSAANGKESVLEFTTRAESGRLPGATATAPIGAALPMAVGVGLAAGGAAATSMTEDSSSVKGMAASSASQIAGYLGEFFVNQGWISSAQAKIAKSPIR
jgi:hypothetical protein